MPLIEKDCIGHAQAQLQLPELSRLPLPWTIGPEPAFGLGDVPALVGGIGGAGDGAAGDGGGAADGAAGGVGGGAGGDAGGAGGAGDAGGATGGAPEGAAEEGVKMVLIEGIAAAPWPVGPAPPAPAATEVKVRAAVSTSTPLAPCWPLATTTIPLL